MSYTTEAYLRKGPARDACVASANPTTSNIEKQGLFKCT